ncbi:MAG: dCMP deaminase, partial [Micromonosporaceae bacterium]|nr:dCMP deaminase [Micromonosporaceae bacterium]
MIHSGYLAFLDRNADATEVLVLGASFADEFPVLRKEIRALAPERAAAYVGGVVVERGTLATAVTADTLVVPDEEIMRALVSAYRLDAGRDVVYERTFLRWDRSWSAVGRPAEHDGVITADELSRSFMATATADAARSSDWWRQVGAVAARDGTVLALAHNE